MSYLALYREWRPKTFDEVVEQKQAVYALRQSVINRQIGHAYLFSGTRGTGKTTLAKIFSRAINCLSPQEGNPCNECELCRAILAGSLMDVIEMDAASNNSVDNIRRICDEVVFMPSQAKYKVYIIDEAHMLSTGAFNALLKTLEEPPAHAVFILATTEPHRLPATILSRCQRYEFRRIPQEGIAARLSEIALSDHISIAKPALDAIAVFADGAMRDAISLLDQAKSSIAGTIERDDILALAGITQDDFMLRMGGSVLSGDVAVVLECIDDLVMSGKDLARFINDLAQFYRNLLVCQISDQPDRLIQATDDLLTRMKQMAGKVRYQTLIKLIQQLSELMSDLRWSSDTRTLLEVGLIRIMTEIKPEMALLPALEQPMQATEPKITASVAPESKTESEAVEKITIDSQPIEIDKADDVPPSTAMATAALPTVSVGIDKNEDVPPPGDDDYPVSSQESTEGESDQESGASIGNDSISGTESPISSILEAEAESAKDNGSESENELLANRDVNPQSDNVSLPDQKEIWQKVLDGLQRTGEMVLFLFGKTAAVQLCQNEFHIIFGPKDKVHHDEFNKDHSRKILQDLLRDACGQNLVMNIRIEEDPEKAAAESCTVVEEPWIRQIREAADQFGIPVKMEE